MVDLLIRIRLSLRFGVIVAFTASALAPAALAADASKNAVIPATMPQNSATHGVFGSALKIGDKLRLVFYEHFQDDVDKWSGNSRTPDGGFHQFTELCGDYVIQEDGALSLPILGRFAASGIDGSQVIANVTQAFTSLLGRNGIVNLISVEHPPVFVVGAVRAPGAFKYWQGMTVLHAVALAGGAKAPDREAWQSVESVRETERLQRSLARVKRLLVRTSVLRAAAGEAAVPAATLQGLVGADVISLASEEQAARELTTKTEAATATALNASIDDARANVKARTDRLAPLDGLIALRQSRERAIAQLVANDTVSTPVLVQTQSELADAQDRKRQASIEVAQAKDHLADVQQDYTKHQSDAAVELTRSKLAAERDTQDAVSDAEGALDLVGALAPKDGATTALLATYRIVRRIDSGTQIFDLPGTALLEPGDLVELSRKEDAVGN